MQGKPQLYQCPECEQPVNPPEAYLDREIKCLKCETRFVPAGNPVGSFQPLNIPATIKVGQTASSEVPSRSPGPMSRSSKIIIAMLGMIICGGIYIAYKQGVFTKTSPIVQAVKTPEYRRQFHEALGSMIYHAGDAETVCAGHVRMWKSATEIESWSIDDAISDSLETYSRTIESLQEAKKTVSVHMTGLRNPPDEFDAAYQKLVTLFGLFNNYVDLAVSPHGTLITYQQSVNESGRELIRYIKEIQVMVP